MQGYTLVPFDNVETSESGFDMGLLAPSHAQNFATKNKQFARTLFFSQIGSMDLTAGH